LEGSSFHRASARKGKVQMISKRTLAQVKSLTDSIEYALSKNVANLLVDGFEDSDLGKEVYQSAYTYENRIDMNITVKSGQIAEQVINYWKDAITGLRVNSFEDCATDTTSPYRTYTMNNREYDEKMVVNIDCYFAEGTCEFVEVDTGEVEEVPERPAEAAFTRKVVKRVLKCDEQEIPTGLPEPAMAIEA
jgi:hypothetical protein